MKMRQLIFAAAICTLASAAYADGPGVVTKIKTLGGGFPACIQFQTNSGPQWYGFAVSEPSADEAQAILNTSRLVKFPITFNVVGAPNALCSDATLYVVGLSW